MLIQSVLLYSNPESFEHIPSVHDKITHLCPLLRSLLFDEADAFVRTKTKFMPLQNAVYKFCIKEQGKWNKQRVLLVIFLQQIDYLVLKLPYLSRFPEPLSIRESRQFSAVQAYVKAALEVFWSYAEKIIFVFSYLDRYFCPFMQEASLADQARERFVVVFQDRIRDVLVPMWICSFQTSLPPPLISHHDYRVWRKVRRREFKDMEVRVGVKQRVLAVRIAGDQLPSEVFQVFIEFLGL
jgi:hypothetical protein